MEPHLRASGLLVLGALLGACPLALSQSQLDGWHRDGQTFLVFDVDGPYTGLESVSIYRSSQPILDSEDLGEAELAGRLFPQDWRAARLGVSHPGSTWTIPDASGTPFSLNNDEGVFVYTPHEAATEYFAVVRTELFPTGPFATTGPIAQSLNPVQPHLQRVGRDGGHPYRIYSVWVDGRVDPDSGRADFPVMAPLHGGGVGHLFCVFEPVGALPPAPRPAVLFLHGGSGSYWTYRPSQSAQKKIDLVVDEGLYVTLDAHQYLRSNGAVNSYTAGWFGTSEAYDRFEEVSVIPPDGTRVIDYHQRRIAWILDWLQEKQGVDPARTAMAGLSGGGRGTHLFARARPERLCASLSFVMPNGVFNDDGPAIWGTFAQNLPTNLPGAPGAVDILIASTPLSESELPFQRFVDGTTDTQAPWDGKPLTYAAFDDAQSGAAIYWDDRGHTASSPTGWAGAFFVGSPRHAVADLLRFRADRSFPAFHSVDHNISQSGQQPDPGDPVVPANGAPHGTWGGWFDWDGDATVETETQWSTRLWLVTGSSFAADNAPLPQARASVTLRRLSTFAPEDGEALRFVLSLDSAPGTVLASGAVGRDALGRITVANLSFGAAPLALSVESLAAAAGLSLYGSATSGCEGLPAIGASGLPQVDSPGFALVAANLPRLAPGVFALGTQTTDIPFLGAQLFVELLSPPALLAIAPANGAGTATWSLPIPDQPQLAGLSLFAQGAWLDTCAPGGWSASRGLALTVQP